ncbi:ATP-binding protein [Shewanella basaltis]|uniref:ATP-binding protein n=1 Tax=Shewanella basaltis TaxID=472183 RepID=UPI00200C794F|nr:ATP-binding protein [Shewanella basaltis]MCL1115142.1 ATP-binding protein [Shewanella basaltis]
MDMTSNKYDSVRHVDATPYASSLIEGHRDFGYSLKTALADIIDNSISADANCIRLVVDSVSNNPSVIIADNGHGMTEGELLEAMRLGSKSPTIERKPFELGRFGLGLKSASFSQCRSLTVITRRNGITSCARWDLDLVSETNAWTLEVFDNFEDQLGYSLLEDKGTVVVWEKLDRLVGEAGTSAKVIENMNAEFSLAERHLRLTFHRFLESNKPQIQLSLNARQLTPLDPTASSHPATQKDPEDTIHLSNGDVRIRSYTIPHYKKMSQTDWDELGGPEGHLKSQGLYIYRENRLIIAGSWLGLAKQTELTKLSRIAIDIPNTMDSQWKIDVKKSSAQLPPLVRERLMRVVERFVGTSKRTYRSRGQRLVESTMHPIWNRVQVEGKIHFKPNIDHPVFQAYSKCLPIEFKEGFERCIRLIAAGLPIDALHAELVGNAESIVALQTAESDLNQVVIDLTEVLLANGITRERVKDTLQNYPLLQSNWEVAERLVTNYLKEKVYE